MEEILREAGDGLYFTLGEAEAAAATFAQQGRLARIEESMFHLGQWVIYAERKP